MNKDERVWVCFEMVRVQTVHVVQRLLYHPCDTQELQKVHAVWHQPK